MLGAHMVLWQSWIFWEKLFALKNGENVYENLFLNFILNLVYNESLY